VGNRLTISALLSFVLLIAYGTGSVYAQTGLLDSLMLATSEPMATGEKIRTYNLIAAELRGTDRYRAAEMAEKAMNLAIGADDRRGMADALTIKGQLSEDSDSFSDALNFYLQALDIYIELDREADIANLHSLAGSVCKTLGNYDKALEHCHASLRIYEKLNNKTGIAYIYRVLGSVYKYKGDYDKSLHYYFNGLGLNEEQGSRSGMANAYNNIGIVYLLMRDVEQALEYYRKSLAINLAEGIETEASINYGNIGVAYLELGMMDSAMKYITKRHTLVQQMNDRKGMATSLEALGDYYLKAGDYDRSNGYYVQALAQSRSLGILETTKSTLKSLSDLYEGRGDYRTSLSYYRAFVNLRDSLLNQETLRRIEQVEMESAYEKEKQEHQLLEQRQKIIRTVIYGTLVFSVLTLFLFFRLQSTKLKQKGLHEKALNLERQQLKNEVTFKDKELFSKALYLAEKNQLISDISRRLTKALADPGGTKNTIKDILKDLKFSSNIQTWEEFEYIFLKVHPEFFNTLVSRFPDLSPNERRLCAFLKLNLSTKDISNITHQSSHSLTVARTRLRKKLGIANTGENLSSFLSQL
jgi:tetratricopeptide (TPR) repeat protein/DNA-binding CsgD family transcriptional regulator